MQKYDVRNKILVDSRGGGMWEDIQRLLNFNVTIDATFTQSAKGREDSKPQYDVVQSRRNGSGGPSRGKESCHSLA